MPDLAAIVARALRAQARALRTCAEALDAEAAALDGHTEARPTRRQVGATVFVSAADVMAALGVPRSTAYEHLRRAAGRAHGPRLRLGAAGVYPSAC